MIRILLVEDSEADAILVEESLNRAGLEHELAIVTDGELAMAAIREVGHGYDLVLLDLNLPRMDGREVLAEIKRDPALSPLPIIVLTTSHNPIDVDFAYRNHANAYLRKPNGLEALTSVGRAIRDFWAGVATLPGPSPFPAA